MDAYRKALGLDPGFVPACLALSSILIQQAEPDEARSICLHAIEKHPDNRLLSDQLRKIEIHPSHQNDEASNRFTEGLEPPPVHDDGRPAILLHSDCSGEDGAEQCSHLIALDLLAAGYRVICAQPYAEHQLIDERIELGIKHLWIEEEDPTGVSGTMEASTWKSRSLFAASPPDLVLFSDGSPVSSLNAKKAAIEAGIPFIILTHCVTGIWSDQPDRVLNDLKEAYAHAEEVISVSAQNLADLHKYFSLPTNKGRVIYNGRPDSFFQPCDPTIRSRIREELGIPMDSVVCTTIARMEVMKGYQYLLSAMEQLKDYPTWQDLKFVWIGTGTLENRLRSLAAEIGVDDSIHFLGFRSDIEDLLEASDMFALPSQYEGMPLSIIEAMAKGLPVIASGVSGIPEALGSTGFLTADPRENPSLAADQMASVIEDWTKRIKKGEPLGMDAHARASKLFGSGNMLRAYRELITFTLQGRSQAMAGKPTSTDVTETSTTTPCQDELQ
jgi:glycosyltransferase involved in cell wall biosynthesis